MVWIASFCSLKLRIKYKFMHHIVNNIRFSQNLTCVGSVRILSVLLKTENWKYRCKIIFEWVNIAMEPIFNIFFLYKVVVRFGKLFTLSPAQWILVHEQYNYCSYALEKIKINKETLKSKCRIAISPIQTGT